MKGAGFYFYMITKPICDYVVSIICLIILIPLILVLSAIIFFKGKGPVIYSQKRTGKDGKTFMIYKFRSLKQGTDEGVDLIADKYDRRITRIGRFMRKYKIDEIPNFINVIRGEMSLVGPRPEQEYYIEKIVLEAPEYKQLQKIKPGITSWGQVKYGYASTVDEMIERLPYDLYYLENRSFLFDLKIILHTIRIVLKGRGL
jgi:lipopolysaccharide/colanic/teichoic acid biosynthesis glycosyltransferase